MEVQIDYGEQPMQMDDYGMDARHYDKHGDCTISPTYGEDDDVHHCGKDANENANDLQTD